MGLPQGWLVNILYIKNVVILWVTDTSPISWVPKLPQIWSADRVTARYLLVTLDSALLGVLSNLWWIWLLHEAFRHKYTGTAVHCIYRMFLLLLIVLYDFGTNPNMPIWILVVELQEVGLLIHLAFLHRKLYPTVEHVRNKLLPDPSGSDLSLLRTRDWANWNPTCLVLLFSEISPHAH